MFEERRPASRTMAKADDGRLQQPCAWIHGRSVRGVQVLSVPTEWALSYLESGLYLIVAERFNFGFLLVDSRRTLGCQLFNVALVLGADEAGDDPVENRAGSLNGSLLVIFGVPGPARRRIPAYQFILTFRFVERQTGSKYISEG